MFDGRERTKGLWCIFSAALVAGWLLAAGNALAQESESTPSPDVARFRRPVAMALAGDDHRLYVANRDSGTVSVVDAVDRRVIGELKVGQRLADLAAWGGDRLLAVDEAAHELIVLERVSEDPPGLTVHARTPVSRYPVSIVVAADGRTAYVASLWSRRVSIIELSAADAESTGAARVRIARTIDLPFAPREQLLVRDGATLIVADSFGGKLALIDTAAGRLDCVRELPAHNIRGLALDPTGRKLLVSHQILNSLAETTHNDVHWGILLINVLRWLSLDRVLDPEAAILGDSHVHPAGDSDGAGGDPAGLAVTTDGTVLLALAGMGRVAMGRETDYSLRGVPAGARPTDVVAAAHGRWACVANTLGDSLTFIDLITGEASAEMPLGSMPGPGPVERGELLFHDARLSLDGWFSCHSCHTDGHANGLLVDNLGDGSFGSAKRVLTLLGTGRTGPWAWNGGVADLGAQVRKSIESTMQGTPPTDEQVADLVAYLNSLPPPPPLAIARAADDAEWKPAFDRGAAVFAKQNCAACHDPNSAFSTPAAYDVGLSATPDERFNPPALRGVSQGGPYLHDNRAATLHDVFAKHRHQVPADISADDLADLLRYLEGL